LFNFRHVPRLVLICKSSEGGGERETQKQKKKMNEQTKEQKCLFHIQI